MWSKIVILLGSIVFLLFYFFYFSTNTSYSMASEAKALYDLGKYDEAIDLAKIAYEKDNYNKMAFTVLTQSKEAKRWVKFIKETSAFLDRTKKISRQNVITKADRFEIKIMSELVMEEYLKLGKRNPLVKDEHRSQAKYLYDQFKKLNDELN